MQRPDLSTIKTQTDAHRGGQWDMRTMALTLLLALMGFGLQPAQAQDDLPLEWVSIEPLAEVIPGAPTHTMQISPDAAMIAWTVWEGEQALCIYTFADDTSACTPAPSNLTISPTVKMAWSPDGRWLALTEDFLRTLTESDIWLFDVSEKQFINRTDDGLTGRALDFRDEPVALDYVPTWNPATGDLYFWRLTRTWEGETFRDERGLYRVAATELTTNTEPEMAADLTDVAIELPVIVANPVNQGLEGVSVISPDGTQLAFLVLSGGQENPGVWVIDLERGVVRQLASQYDLLPQIGLPTAMLEAYSDVDFLPFLPLTLAWTSDSAGLVVTSENTEGEFGVPFAVSYWLNAETGEALPLIDWTDVETPNAFYTEPGADGFTARYDVTAFAVLLPTSADDLFLFMNQDVTNQQQGLSALPLPPDGRAPLRIHTFDTFHPVQPLNFYTMGEDGETVRVLMLGYLITLRWQEGEDR